MAEPHGAPVLSTPDSHILDQAGPGVDLSQHVQQSDDQLRITYEIQRTVEEIRQGRWKRIALQFPDHMLPDAPRVFQALSKGLARGHAAADREQNAGHDGNVDAAVETLAEASLEDDVADRRLFILGDTSYGSCCVDEVAAEHADADVVVHYGRSCLSPTARLPVIYIYTNPPLDMATVVQSFEATYPDKSDKIILTADIPFMDRMPALGKRLHEAGYTSLFVTALQHQTSSPIPNRTVPGEADAPAEHLLQWKLFHVSDPPESLLLTLSARVKAVHFYSTADPSPAKASEASSSRALRRRYATLVKLATVPVFGILINTLSVQNYMGILAHVKQRIAAAGKKSYTFVVGKVNAAKVANFGEVGGWVVIGCWESSLLESKEFWKPVITPYELEYALTDDDTRVWTGAWSSDFAQVLQAAALSSSSSSSSDPPSHSQGDGYDGGDDGDEEDSAPPEFDLRTGRYVSHSRPMAQAQAQAHGGPRAAATRGQALIKRQGAGEVAMVGGVVSPAAEFLQQQRSWQGLGSDFAVEYDAAGAPKAVEGAVVETGRVGIAKGYTVGEQQGKEATR